MAELMKWQMRDPADVVDRLRVLKERRPQLFKREKRQTKKEDLEALFKQAGNDRDRQG